MTFITAIAITALFVVIGLMVIVFGGTGGRSNSHNPPIRRKSSLPAMQRRLDVERKVRK